MLASLRLVSALVLAVVLSTSSDALHIRRDAAPITLPFARRVNATGAAKLLKIDQARAKTLKSRSMGASAFKQSAVFNVPASNQAVEYTTTVSVGNPPQTFNLLIDTGSSNTWVGAQTLTNPFLGSGTTQPTGELVEVTYGSGFVIGQEFVDGITLGGLTIQNQSFGSALLSEGFDDVDGILGIGPSDLTCGTLVPDVTGCIPTVTDNAFSQGLIDAHEIGISFEPTTSVGNQNGELTFGGIDPTKFNGPLNFVPITSTSPANEFVGIDQSITYGSGDGTTVLSATSGITDTGTTLTLLATDAFNTYQNLTGAVSDANTGLLRLTPDQFANLQSLFFKIGDNTLEFTPNAQIWPRALNTLIGGTSDFVYLIVNDLGSLSGEGLDFIDGMTFLERFYYVFDIANSRVGFATTPFTDATAN
ncbi:acid protease [Lentinus tigrinus ALCF2SS1-7]|uniref:Acid protease n=1 Tax=Lentinus tigrinus ALCF2SS1-6 TaxID=1328759 RepID=A0A5C2SGX7_9APHY|nr:acid protease [Lentinus tigrinus ALCF2SS1-6]RPD75828.1 acid protease [Lentinus tigrinus ALCF2SS1-7]